MQWPRGVVRLFGNELKLVCYVSDDLCTYKVELALVDLAEDHGNHLVVSLNSRHSF